MIDFSIIFNSRGRVPMLRQMLRSIVRTASDISKIEVIVNFDNDDQESLSAIPSLEEEFGFAKFLSNDREVNIHVNVNKMAFRAKGKYIWALGDDCHILTKDWDLVARNKFDAFEKICNHGIFLGAVNSTSVDKDISKIGWYCDAPILTAKGRDALGYLIHPHFISLGADVATWMIYSGAGGLVVDMKEVVFDHTTHNTIEKVINPDKTAAEYRARQSIRQPLDPWSYDYSSDIEKLRKAIKA